MSKIDEGLIMNTMFSKHKWKSQSVHHRGGRGDKVTEQLKCSLIKAESIMFTFSIRTCFKSS